MEVHFSPDLELKLHRVAAQQGRQVESIINEAVERMIDDDEWFSREVGKGLASADGGELVDHSDVGELIEKRYRS